MKPRKRAADFLSDDEDTESKAAATEKQTESEKSKPSKKKPKKGTEEDTSATAVKEKAPRAEAKAEKSKKSDAGAKAEKKKKEEIVNEDFEDDDEDEEVSGSDAGQDEDESEDDQTAALIKGFESSGDEDPSEDEGFDPDKPVPQIPDSKKTKRKILKKQKQKKESQEEEKPGTVYVGYVIWPVLSLSLLNVAVRTNMFLPTRRIPHGFYEHQMRAYFSQFGEITRLRLSRNRVTGRSKHYAFIEFASETVAKIVAETMDNYLMYGHILKVKFVPQEQLHPKLWKGANRRFKKTPWNKIEKKRLEKGKTREKWAEKIEREQKRRLAKAEKMKALGYEFELPKLKSVDEVPVRGENKAIEAGESAADGKKTEETPKALEAPVKNGKVKQDEDTPKKSKKEKKEKKANGAADGKEEPKKDAAAAESKKGTTAETTASPAGKTEKKAQKDKAGADKLKKKAKLKA